LIKNPFPSPETGFLRDSAQDKNGARTLVRNASKPHGEIHIRIAGFILESAIETTMGAQRTWPQANYADYEFAELWNWFISTIA
jgi:hypothetical protein